MLLVRIAVLRFTIGAQARLAADMDAAAFDALAVRVIYNVARMCEHSQFFLDKLRAELERHGMQLAHAVSLIQL